MTLTLSPEIEKVLTDAAAKQGRTPDELVEETLRTQYLSPNNASQHEADELSAKVKAARGMFSHISGGSYEFMRNKVYEKLLEERHW